MLTLGVMCSAAEIFASLHLCSALIDGWGGLAEEPIPLDTTLPDNRLQGADSLLGISRFEARDK